jgi:hypothetical protein
VDEVPRLRQQASWNTRRVEPLTPPGSVEEEEALAQLDAARAQEERALQETREERRRRHERYWRRHAGR